MSFMINTDELWLGFKKLKGESEIGISYDFCVTLFHKEDPFGKAYLTVLSTNQMYLEWIEMHSPYKGKGLFKPFLDLMVGIVGPILLEATEETEVIYQKYNAKFVEYDSNTELNMYLYDGKE